MKTENKKPTLKDGWLLASKKVLYGNSPMIRVSSINVLNYYEDEKINTSKTLYNRGEPSEWYITFGDNRKWYYENENILLKDYNVIASLLLKEERELRGVDAPINKARYEYEKDYI